MKYKYTKQQLLSSLRIEKKTNRELKSLVKKKGFKNLKPAIKVSDRTIKSIKKLLDTKHFS